MEIKKENVVNAYMAGDDNTKKILREMFPDIDFETEKMPKLPITERVKSFEDACRELGYYNPFVVAYNTIISYTHFEEEVENAHDLIAYLKLRIICAALNEGWQPQFTADEWRYYPWFYLYTKDELNQKSADWKSKRTIVPTGDYQTEYADFACAGSHHTPSQTAAHLGSRLCFKNEALADYCGKQFIHLWADFCLIRRK